MNIKIDVDDLVNELVSELVSLNLVTRKQVNESIENIRSKSIASKWNIVDINKGGK